MITFKHLNIRFRFKSNKLNEDKSSGFRLSWARIKHPYRIAIGNNKFEGKNPNVLIADPCRPACPPARPLARLDTLPPGCLPPCLPIHLV